MQVFWGLAAPWTLSRLLSPNRYMTLSPSWSLSTAAPSFIRFCHTAWGDPRPALIINYPCSAGLSKVVVTNRVDECCKDRIRAFALSVLDAAGNRLRPDFAFTTNEATFTIPVEHGEKDTRAGMFIPPCSAEPLACMAMLACFVLCPLCSFTSRSALLLRSVRGM